MNKFESASILAGMSPNEEPQVSEPTNLHVITGEVVSKSEDGTVMVSMDGLVFSEDDTQYIEMDTIGGLEEGDEATILLAGENGSAMSPLVVGSPGSVDRIRETAENASQVADAAQAVAEATNQHFFSDDGGIHVTEATQEDWDENHSGANVLINSIGQLFRDGLTNLLAILTTGVAIYDGNGNESSNILASFTSSGVVIGKGSSYHLVVSSTGMQLQSGQNNLVIFSFDRDGITFAEDRKHTISLYNILHEIVADSSGLHLYASGDPVEDSPVARIDLNATAGSTTGNGSIKFTTRVGSNTWSTPAGTVLWSGAYHMTASHTASLAHNVSTCPTGIVLHWQAYVSGSARNQDQLYCFVPKTHVTNFAGGGVQMPLMTSGFGNVGCKYVYVYDDRVTGAANNNQSGTASGITYNNAYWVLTQIIAV